MKEWDINNRTLRRKLINCYLNTETTVDEERLLADYFRHHAPEEEESDAALLLLAMQQMTGPGDDVDENAEATFDELVQHPAHSKSKVTLRLAIFGVAAAAVVLFIMVIGTGHTVKQEPLADKQEARIVATPPTQVAKQPPRAVTHPQREPQLAKMSNVTVKRKKAERHKTSANSTEEKRQNQLPVEEMVKQIQTITSSDIAEISVRPVGDAAIITATDADGTERSYLTLNSENDTIRYILAFDN